MLVRQYVILFLLASVLAIYAQEKQEEEFSEELLLRPLSDGKILAHFHFTHLLPPTVRYGHHHVLFPKAIFQLVQKFRIREMELSFTQGRWNYNKWGSADPLTRLQAKPSGVELWATFAVSEDQIDATWGNLTHALSGLFCASLNFLESSVMVSNPAHTVFSAHGTNKSSLSLKRSFKQDANRKTNREAGKSLRLGQVRYGALPREAVCTENLTPWLKLLPCRDRAGLATLLDRPTIYKGFYHSLRLYVKCHDFDKHLGASIYEGTFLQQTLSLVILPSKSQITAESRQRPQPNWSIASLFGRHLKGRCLVARSSSIFLEIESPVFNKLEHSGIDIKSRHDCRPTVAEVRNEISQSNCADTEPYVLSDLIDNNLFTMHGIPSYVTQERTASGIGILFTFTVPKHGKHLLDNLGLTWKVPVSWTPIHGPFRATRFLTGSGNARGSIALMLRSNYLPSERSVGWQATSSSEVELSKTGDIINVTIFQVVPWYVRLYFHTLQVLIDEQRKSFWQVVRWIEVVPSKDRKSPGIMEMELMVPHNTSTVTLIIEFDKGFLRIDEHPPDANRGFDLPSALLSFPSEYSEGCYHHFDNDTNGVPAYHSELLKELKKKKPVQIYTEVLLVPLATPDFSMPYNVITLTCTVLALYFGSLLNVLRRRIGAEERLLNKPDEPQSKLERLLSRLLGRYGTPPTAARIAKVLKLIFVVGVVVTINHFLSNS